MWCGLTYYKEENIVRALNLGHSKEITEKNTKKRSGGNTYFVFNLSDDGALEAILSWFKEINYSEPIEITKSRTIWMMNIAAKTK